MERRTPIRSCVSCRMATGKASLIRVVRTPSGEVRLDPTGKAAGRGAYVCGTKECLALAIKRNKLGRALRCEMPERVVTELQNLTVRDNVGE